MSNNLPQKYENTFFKKLFRYFKNLFSFKKKNVVEEKDKANLINNENLKENFLQSLKVENISIDKEIEKKNYMDNLKDNLELLEDFSSEKLEKILQYYLDENENKKAILKKLSA